MKKTIKFECYVGESRSFIMCEILKKIQGKSAIELLEAYGVENEVPVRIDDLLSLIGISVISADFANIEEEIGYDRGEILGATLIEGEEVAMFYRDESTNNRKRFTLAHELAHCCIHTSQLKETNIQLRQGSVQDREEIDANIFAGELLIPKKILLKYYNKLIVPSLKALAEIFEVSTSVMAARLDWLDLPYYKDTDVNEG